MRSSFMLITFVFSVRNLIRDVSGFANHAEIAKNIIQNALTYSVLHVIEMSGLTCLK